MKKKIPKFKSEEEAALFWENHEILDWIEPDEFKVVHPQEKHRYPFRNPKKRRQKSLISLRIDNQLLDEAKKVASRKQVGYQSVLHRWLEKGAA